jgi:hypothetical protein
LRQEIIKPNVTREKLLNLLLHKKFVRKMLMKLTPAVNFINVLRTCFSYKILAPKITKPNVTREKLHICFCTKTERKMLLKLTPGDYRKIERFLNGTKATGTFY